MASRLLFVLCLILPAVGSAVEAGGVTFVDRITVGDTALAVRGAGTLRYRLVFTVYAAVLYQDAAQSGGDPLADVAKRLELNYFYDISAADFQKATDETIGSNCDAAALTALKPRLTRYKALYQDIKPGQRYALTYRPGMGTELAKDDVALGTIEGADFAQAIFAIWLGAKPLDSSLKSKLVGE